MSKINNRAKKAANYLGKSVEQIIAPEGPKKAFGVKNNYQLRPMAKRLEECGYTLHTVDRMALNARAIDVELINPLTGRLMTGSSSGTAINVFCGINDVGIGSDGGGSVLAPAMSLNLFGYIDKQLPIASKEKKSTDGISFSASAGLITREASELKSALKLLGTSAGDKTLKIAIPKKGTQGGFGEDVYERITALYSGKVHEITFPDIYGDREGLITWLSKTMLEYDVILSLEGPVDYFTYGDSIAGLFSDNTRLLQAKSGKGLLRVANMVSASALTIPINEISSGLLCLGKAPADVLQMLELVSYEGYPLIDQYFVQAEIEKDEFFEEKEEEN